ncbi:MAG TPA: hypothetical protein VG755_17680 [Nannocystaceae bacterium]|nr:hypothetical protein [Nannocystaceae bacterium]
MTRKLWANAALGSIAMGLGLASCGDKAGEDDETTQTMTSISITVTTAMTGETDSMEGNSADETGEKLDIGSATTNTGCGNTDLGCTDQIDLLFVIDNSGTMSEEQINLAKNFPLLIRKLEDLEDSGGNPVMPDVQILVTTTDFGNPLCTPFQPMGYTPAKGAPTVTGCNARIADFTGLGSNPIMVPEACTNLCPADIVPDDPFIAFSPAGDNINDSVVPTDIDGDTMEESPAAQALACVGPQGFNGCGYEAPLETMLQALNPNAEWNDVGNKPFLRPGALLAIAIVTDEVECSVKDYTIMEDPSYQETNPDNGNKQASSAICWNAGVSCNGPDAGGVYSDCMSLDDGKLQPLSRYTDYLVTELRESQGKEVIMLGILGVPLVTAYNEDPPHQPIAGGELDLVYRDWADGMYPAGDILPAEFADGTDAADKQFDFGIGPGCTGQDAMGNFTGQATPNTRVMDVCHSLDYTDGAGAEQIRCCITSICDDDFSDAINCLAGIIEDTIQPPG